MKNNILILALLGILLHFNSCHTSSKAAHRDSSPKLSEVSHFKQIDSVRISIQPVQDFDTFFLRKEEKEALGKFLWDYEKKTSNEIVVVFINEISPYTDPKELGTDLGNFWGIGKKEKDNGLVLIIKPSQRMVSISTGTGTEKILTDSICQLAIDDFIIPNFAAQENYKRIKEALDFLIKEWDK